jgi:hypothetical protein
MFALACVLTTTFQSEKPSAQNHVHAASQEAKVIATSPTLGNGKNKRRVAIDVPARIELALTNGSRLVEERLYR